MHVGGRGTNMTEKPGKTQRVLASIRSMIERGHYPKGFRLPSLRNIAATFSVSAGTVEKAMGVLASEGLVRKYVGSGICVASNEEELSNPLIGCGPPLRRTEQIANDIAARISSGDWKTGDNLPSTKALRFLLRTSPQTLRKALHKSERDGLLHQAGNKWVVGPPAITAKRKSNRVYSLSAGAPTLAERLPRAVSVDFVLPFEKELANHGIPLSANRGPNDPNLPNARMLARKDALGFLVHGYNENWARSKKTSQNQLEQELKWISNLGVPSVVFNCAPVLGRFPKFSFKPFVNVFPVGTDNREAGQVAGFHITAMGHRRMAFFSYSSDFWNAHRLEGLSRTAISDKARVKEVKPFQANFNKEALFRMGKWSKDNLMAPLKVISEELFPSYKGALIPEWPKITSPVGHMLVREHQRSLMDPLFEQALEDRAITAWIASDPSIALAAKKYLRQKNNRVPGNISLISIDDDKDLAFAGITSVNLQKERLGYLAAHCLLGDIPIIKNRKGMIFCPPRIIDRGSVRRV